MRISSVVKFIEDQAITVGGGLYNAGKTFAHDVSVEAKARSMYAAETKDDRKVRLAELKGIVEATDQIAAPRSNEALLAEIVALRAQLAAKQVKSVKSTKRARRA